MTNLRQDTQCLDQTQKIPPQNVRITADLISSITLLSFVRSIATMKHLILDIDILTSNTSPAQQYSHSYTCILCILLHVCVHVLTLTHALSLSLYIPWIIKIQNHVYTVQMKLSNKKNKNMKYKKNS
jgi:hypothetical protein